MAKTPFNKPFYDVKEYGAIGDGTTDDRTAINNAIAAANTAGGGIVFFPLGTYNTSGSLTSPGAGVTLVAYSSNTTITGSASGTVLYRNITARLPKRVFPVTTYGSFNDLTNSDLPAIQAAINACVAAGGGIVLLDAIDWLLDTSGSPYLTFPADLGFEVVIQGLGKYNTSVRLGPNTRTFIAPDGVLTGNTHTYQNLTLQDFTVNARNANSTDLPSNNLYGVIFGTAGKWNLANLAFRRLRTINVGNLLTSGLTSTAGSGAPAGVAITQERRNIDITVPTTSDGLNGATQYTITNIGVEDCNFGDSGGGGNAGVLVQAFYGGSDKVANKVYNTPWISNVWIEDIRYSRCKYDSGSTPTSSTQPSVSGFGSAGFMIGSQGRGTNWLIEECVSKRGGDPGFELDSGLRTKVVRCHAEDCWNVGFYFANIGGGADTYGFANPEQHILIDSCTGKRVTVTNMQNLLVHQPKFATPHGTITVNNFTSISNLSAAPVNGQNPVEFRGDIRKLEIFNLRLSEVFTDSTGSSPTQRGLSIALRGGKSNVVIDGIYDYVDMTGSGGAGVIQRPTYALHVADGVVDIKNVVRRHRFALSGGYTARSWDADITQTGGQNYTDTFGAGSQSITTDFIVDGGSISNVSQTGTINCVANATTENRFIWLMASGNGSWQNIGPFTDQSFSIKSTPGPTLSGHKTGIILKRDPRDPTTYIECYVTDNGTQSTLVIDKILAGTRTNLTTSAALGTRISNGVSYWVRGKISGNVITADYYTTAPGAISGSGATTATTTLTGTDVQKIGEQAQGRGGFSWNPADLAATVDDLKVDWFQVIRGVFSNHMPLGIVGPVTQAYGLNFEANAGTWRYPGNALKIVNNDWTALEGNTSMVELNFVDSAMKTSLLATQNTWNTAPAAATISPSGSPFTYTNSQAYRQRVGIYGGTVSSIQLTDKGGTSTQLGGATNLSLTLDPGEAVIVTYSVVPTMNQVPVR